MISIANKHAAGWLLIAAMAAAAPAQAEPSRLFSGETGEVAKELSVDLDYNTSANPGSVALAAGLRAAAFGGEVLVNSKNPLALDGSGFVTSNAGFKLGLGSGFAAYGILAYGKTVGPAPASVTVTTTDFAIGAAYTMRVARDFILNANLELATDDLGANGRGNVNTMFIRLGGAYPVQLGGSRITLIGEIVANNSTILDTVISLGARWEARKNINVDFVLYNDRGNLGSSSGIPGVIRANIAF